MIGALGVVSAMAGLRTQPLFAAQTSGGQQHPYPASPYYKSISFFKRVDGLSQQQFIDHWVDVHAPLYQSAPGLVKYRLNFIDHERSQNTPYDGAAEVWFENESVLRGSAQSDAARNAAADNKLFMQADKALVLPTIEYVILEPPTGPTRPKVKRIGVVPRNPKVSYGDMVREWVDVHAADYLKSTPGIRGYTINVVRESNTGPWNGYASLWWDDQASYDEAARVDAAAAAAAAASRPATQQPAGANAGASAVRFMSVIATERVIR